MIDNFRHKGLRNKMVTYLKEECAIDNINVLEAMSKVPRHLFLDSSFLDFAYQDKAFPIGDNQTISSIYTVAFQSQLIDLCQGDKVLEIGTGSGYQTAVLAEMKGEVYSIERHRSLYKKSKKILQNMNYRVNSIYGDGYLGYDKAAPFDKILVTCGASKVPPALLDQLKIGGVMVIPIGEVEQVMTVIIKKEEGIFSQVEHSNFKFVPLLRDKS
jgi:protein-L-isoaspartate(D-aspartate) O-methyltransferase